MQRREAKADVIEEFAKRRKLATTSGGFDDPNIDDSKDYHNGDHHCDDNGDNGYNCDGDGPVVGPSEGAQADIDEDEVEANTRKRRLTGKQKYQQAAAHVKKIRRLIDDEWLQHGVDRGTKHQSERTEFGISIVDEHREPKLHEDEAEQESAFAHIHPSHRRMQIRHIVFCKSCGYNTSRKTQKLREECPLQPKHNDAKHKLRRMLAGKHPDKDAAMWPDGLSTQVRVPPSSLDQG